MLRAVRSAWMLQGNQVGIGDLAMPIVEPARGGRGRGRSVQSGHWHRAGKCSLVVE